MATNIWDGATGITFGDLQPGGVKKPQQRGDSEKQIPEVKPDVPPAAPNPIFMGVPDGIAKNMAPNPNRKPAPETFNNLPAVSASPAPTSVPVPVATSAPVTAPKAVAATEENPRPVEMDPFAYRGGQSFGGKGPTNGPNSTALDPVPADAAQASAANFGPQNNFGQKSISDLPGLGVGFVTGNGNGVAPEPYVKPGFDKNGVVTAESAKAAYGNDMQRSGGIFGTYDGKAVNDILAREVAIRGELQKLKDGSSGLMPPGFYGELPDRTQQASQGPSISDLQSAMKSAGTRTERAAYGQLLQTALAGQNQLAQEQLRQQGIAQGLGVQMRGQDITAASEANKLSIDAPYRRAQTSGQEQQNRSAGVVADLQQRAIAGDAKAIETLRAINGKSSQATDRFMSVQGGEEIGPDGMTKIKRPGGVFDAQTGQFVPMNPQQGGKAQAPAAALDYLKKNPGQAEAFKAKYGYLPEGF